tara:strand:+ start:490 stop:714 length:225 start_codon:yes stop_codon:yes gene_type:complete
MPPAFLDWAKGVGDGGDILRPFHFTDGVRVWSMWFHGAAKGKFRFVAGAAKGAGDIHHFWVFSYLAVVVPVSIT